MFDVVHISVPKSTLEVLPEPKQGAVRHTVSRLLLGDPETECQRLEMHRRYVRSAYDVSLEWVVFQQKNNLTMDGVAKALGYAKYH